MSYKECVQTIALLVCNELACDLLGFIYITGTKREKNKVASSVCTYREKERTLQSDDRITRIPELVF
jgi:hypothetical protein